MVTLKLKIIVDKRENRVLFAEARKDFVDFVVHILSLPLGAVMRVLSGAGYDIVKANNTMMPSCLGSLYKSIEDLDDTQIDLINKESLLNPKAPFWGSTSHELLPGASLPAVRDFLQCAYCKAVTVFNVRSKKFCLSCSSTRNDSTWIPICGLPAEVVAVKGGGDAGYVKQQLYMVTDNLVVKPMSAVCALSLMGPKDRVGDFENKEVNFGPIEALKLLKASLWSKTVLTEVFVGAAA